ncbi:MAG: hypothetical protein H7239_00255 [Flavobacterium sp.]|nr:hypothetical protein [Flavobacterium sp.]
MKSKVQEYLKKPIKIMSKKILIMVTLIGMMMLQSCTVQDSQPSNIVNNNTVIGEVFEVTRSFTPANNFSNLVAFPHTIYASDMILVYRLSGVSSGADIWKLLPETYYTSTGTLDFRYDFDFTKYDASIYMDGFDLATVSNNYRLNQVLRIVIIPANFSNKTSLQYDINDYSSVANYFKIDNSKVLKIN